MKTIGLTQRVVIDPRHGERRDCLDQRWAAFILACGFRPLPLPNNREAALLLLNDIDGLVLTGGNDLAFHGGDAPERDAAELSLLAACEQDERPMLGVCRGMQVIQHRYGVPLQRVTGHVARHQTITIDGTSADVNSFHNFGTTETRPPLEVWAVAPDRIVKAVRRPDSLVTGIMWHPERLHPFAERDMALVRKLFCGRDAKRGIQRDKLSVKESS